MRLNLRMSQGPGCGLGALHWGGTRLRALARAVVPVLAASALLLPAPAGADTADAIANELRREGYSDVRIERTLLGRTRILGEGPPGRREVVIDRGTGEILRDLSEAPRGAPRRGPGAAQ
jgi:hypothetical protein